MKPSEITIHDIKDFMRIDFDFDDNFLEIALASAKGYVESYTRRKLVDDLDQYKEISMVIYALVVHFYEVRTFIVSDNGVNEAVKKILGMHSYSHD